MKQLVFPGNVVKQSGRIWNKWLYKQRPPHVCFQQIWRDCPTDSIYLVFQKGGTYKYPSPSAGMARSLPTSDIIGLAFNILWRRGTAVVQPWEGPNALIPGTAALVYSYPPYPGTDPGDCPPGVPQVCNITGDPWTPDGCVDPGTAPQWQRQQPNMGEAGVFRFTGCSGLTIVYQVIFFLGGVPGPSDFDGVALNYVFDPGTSRWIANGSVPIPDDGPHTLTVTGTDFVSVAVFD